MSIFNLSEKNLVTKKDKLKSLIISTVIGYLLSLILLFILSIVITYTNLNENLSIYLVRTVTYISVLVAGFYAAGKITDKGWLSGLITGGCYSIILIIISTVLKQNQIGFSHVLQLVICIVTGIAGGIIGINTKKRKSIYI